MAKILVIETDYCARLSYDVYLGDRKLHKLLYAHTRLEALKHIRENKNIDLVIADLDLKYGENSLNVVDYIKNTIWPCKVKDKRPLIILTGNICPDVPDTAFFDKASLLKNLEDNYPRRNPKGKNSIDKFLERHGIMPSRPATPRPVPGAEIKNII